jgi:hypothetical protein
MTLLIYINCYALTFRHHSPLQLSRAHLVQGPGRLHGRSAAAACKVVCLHSSCTLCCCVAGAGCGVGPHNLLLDSPLRPVGMPGCRTLPAAQNNPSSSGLCERHVKDTYTGERPQRAVASQASNLKLKQAGIVVSSKHLTCIPPVCRLHSGAQAGAVAARTVC